MKPILLQPAFVLHRRPYRETSFLVELFTPEYGRLSCVAKGVRKPKSAWQGLIQPFVPLIISWVGKSELMTLTHAENDGMIKPLLGDALYTGFYLNELILALLQKWDPHPTLYQRYQATIHLLQQAMLTEAQLRSFELYLLHEIGYGLLPKQFDSLHNTFAKDGYYQFTPERGFQLQTSGQSASVFSGESLIAIAQEDWRDKTILQDAKRLIRCVLTPLLGKRKLYSRQLFVQPAKEEMS